MIDFRNAQHDALLESLARGDQNVPQKGAGRFAKEGFDQIEPRPMFGRVDIPKAIGFGDQPGHGFLGDMGGMVI